MRRLLLLLAVSVSIQAETLTIYNWEEYLSDAVVQGWEQRSGHQVKQIYYDNDEERDSVLVNASGEQIDIIISDEAATPFFGNKGKLAALSEYTPNTYLEDISDRWRSTCGDYGLPYLWGTLGVVYHTEHISEAPQSWKQLLDPPIAWRGHIGLIDDFVDTLVPALFSLNADINTSDRATLQQAFELSKKALPHILTFEYAISALDNERSKDELYIAIAYSGDQEAMNEKAGKEVWKYTTLSEGTVVWTDCISVLADSPNKKLAYDFLDYLYDSEVFARNSEELYFASPLKSSAKLQSKEFLEDRTVYPTQAQTESAQRYRQLSSDNIKLRNRITSSLIKLHDAN